ncbi:hypothetical protein BCR35DRAFT_327531 [Leucosporidium creatinivorum]|uniref:Uncharacterized protein n=1 Tax=Leucosporidium creatinivorum TaxID=106004 RepID=A0A1Y2G768_9BASI|nr:hypothetical protein BCR35DRAFT_327531 [Leucosporidium creatinivorum]
MEPALRSAFGSKKNVVPAEPEGSLEDFNTYHHVIELLLAFTNLWTRTPYFLAAEPAFHSISTDLASRAYMTLVVYRQETPCAEQTTKLLELWEGRVDDYHPIAGLMEDHHWRSTARRAAGTLKCRDIIENKIRQVNRRMVPAPNLSLSHAQLTTCAAVYLAYERGMSNLTRWQRAVLLDHHGVPQSSSMSSLGHHHLPSLTSRQQERSGVSEEGLRARWA